MENITEWTKYQRKANDYLDAVKEDLLRRFPTLDDFQNNRNEIEDAILKGLKETDQNDYEQSQALLNKKKKSSEALALIRKRNNIKKKINRFYQRLCNDLYNQDSRNEPVINTTMRGIFRHFDDEVEETTQSISNLNIEPTPIQADEKQEDEELSQDPSEIYPSSFPLSQETIAPEEEAIPLTQEDLNQLEEVVTQEEATQIEEKPVCAICLEEFEGNIQEEAVFCHKNFHPLHIVCRFRWAEQKKHTCPVCRESFEEDDGEMFCRVYGLSKQKKIVIVVVTMNQKVLHHMSLLLVLPM